MTLKWTLTVIVLIKFSALANSQGLEYVLNFDSPIYVCPDDDSVAFVDTSEVQVTRLNETTAVMTGVIKFLKGFEEDTMIELIIEKDVGGSLEMITSHDICDMCKELSNSESVYREYLQYFGFPATCPFEPNSYPINDFVADTNNLPINSATAGRYQVTMNIYKNTDDDCLSDGKIFIACLKLDFVIEPL